ncbi:TetR/AcrR family transcriptional regulator [Streptomyces sp. NPDC048558]|uniref:TetR/AcrR family transcriptional regulator n=1 Tax=Streptomyces sp. NPDC048558 TaxID=3155759 RepID=UPI0033C06D81
MDPLDSEPSTPPAAAPRRRRAQRGDGARLRDELVEAAERLLDKAGEDAVTIRAVAQAVGVSLPAVYLHFGSRLELLHTVCLRVWGELGDWMGDASADAGSHDPFNSLHQRSVAYVRFGLAHPVRYRLVMTGPATAASGQVASACFRFLRGTVQECVEAGVLRGDATALTRAIAAALHGAVALLIFQPPESWPEDVDGFARDIATLATRGAAAIEP